MLWLVIALALGLAFYMNSNYPPAHPTEALLMKVLIGTLIFAVLISTGVIHLLLPVALAIFAVMAGLWLYKKMDERKQPPTLN